jgi:hypothetical protein
MSIWFFIAMFTKFITFGNFAFYEGKVISVKDAGYYSEGNKFYFSRGYWESYCAKHRLTRNDIEKLELIGWGDLARNTPTGEKV